MNPPTPEQVDSALAALTGTVTEEKPETDLARNMLRLRLVMLAKERGVPWTAIGAAMGGLSGAMAKREMKHLARVTQRQLLAGSPRPKPQRHRQRARRERPVCAVGWPHAED